MLATRIRPLPLALAAAVVALGIGVTAALADDPPAPRDPATSSGDVTRAELEGRTKIEFVSLGGGCRFFDTRAEGGPLAIGETRTFSVQDGDIAAQGGVSGGCQVPDHAVAVDLSLSTTAGSPTNPGFVRIGPGGAVPTATVLQFVKGEGSSVTTTADLDASGELAVRMNAAASHLVGDLLGYWQQSLFAFVSADGTVGTSQGLLFPAATKRLGEGSYELEFERAIFPECVPVATASAGSGTVAQVVRTEAEIAIETRDFGGTLTDGDFYVSITC